MLNIEVIKNKGSFQTLAVKDFVEGEVVLRITGKETLVRDRYTIQLKPDLHIIPDQFSGKYVNHSCLPNSKVNCNREFVALREIKEGDELTFDYKSTEDELAEKFKCNCGNSNCRGIIQ